MNSKENNIRLIFWVLMGVLVLLYRLDLSLAKTDRTSDYIPEGSVITFLFKANKNDPGVGALTGRALEKLSDGRISRQTGQNILSLISGESLIVAFPSDAGQGADKLEYGIVTGYVRENFDFTFSLKGNPVRMKAKTIPDLENKVLGPLIEQMILKDQGNPKESSKVDKSFNREVFQGYPIVSLAKKEGVERGITAYSFGDGKLLLGSTADTVKKLLRSKEISHSYPFYEPFIKGKNDGLLLADNNQGRLTKLIQNDKNLAEFGTILSWGQVHKAALSFDLVDENSLTGVLDVFPEDPGRLGFLEKEIQLLGAFLKGRLFLEGLSWSNEVQKQEGSVRMEFKIGNLKKYFEED
ncbi:MAG TPA: hypothetical protein VNM22_11565 [Candidatus Limnocylindrales bacterium]|nr:hypothetical protein [Candidatus Limnocylindrales bacterium]